MKERFTNDAMEDLFLTYGVALFIAIFGSIFFGFFLVHAVRSIATSLKPTCSLGSVYLGQTVAVDGKSYLVTRAAIYESMGERDYQLDEQ